MKLAGITSLRVCRDIKGGGAASGIRDEETRIVWSLRDYDPLECFGHYGPVGGDYVIDIGRVEHITETS